ncbi:unnamed protein product [Polarella glacialis]|uniref:SET domain-containing protein n=1 Tax=Polarella glacialis TaxID=89957 RepID=A0A813LUV5_POLGL|nr:unnamed protein product [Polarella glacialis]CAE8738896.1 unnamed protein product [Polarella glacialis]
MWPSAPRGTLLQPKFDSSQKTVFWTVVASRNLSKPSGDGSGRASPLRPSRWAQPLLGAASGWAACRARRQKYAENGGVRDSLEGAESSDDCRRNAASDSDLDFVLAETTDGRGRCLRTTRALPAGHVIIQEKPLFVWPSGWTTRRIAIQLQQLSPDVRQDLLSLSQAPPPLAGHDGEDVSDGAGGGLLSVLRANAVMLQQGGGAVCLTVSRANHSCQPNALLAPEASGEVRIVLLRALEVGEEVLVSYLSGDDLLRPTLQRQRELQRGPWGFCCSCPRCSAPDDVRCLRCPVCALGLLRPHARRASPQVGAVAGLPSGEVWICDGAGGGGLCCRLEVEAEAAAETSTSRSPSSSGEGSGGARIRTSNAPTPPKLEDFDFGELELAWEQRLAQGPLLSSDALLQVWADVSRASLLASTHWVAFRAAQEASKVLLARGRFAAAGAAAKHVARFVHRVHCGAISLVRLEAVALRAEAAAAFAVRAEAVGRTESAARARQIAKLLAEAGLAEAALVLGESHELVERLRQLESGDASSGQGKTSTSPKALSSRAARAAVWDSLS